MSAFSAAVLLLLAGVNYGWQPMGGAETDSQGVRPAEYIVQVGPEDLRSIASGASAELTSEVPAEVGRVGRVKIQFGVGQPPRVVSGHAESRLQEVGKPVLPDWPEPQTSSEPHPSSEPQSRTAFQNPQEFNLDGLQQGFGQATQPTRQGPLREFAGNLAEATRQNLNDLGDGARGVFEGAAGGVQSTVDALGNIGRNTINAGNPDYFDQRRAAAQMRSQQSATAPPPAWSANQAPTQQGESFNNPQQRGFTAAEPDLFDNDLPQDGRDRGVSPAGGQIATSFADDQDASDYRQQDYDGYRRSQLAPVSQPPSYDPQPPPSGGFAAANNQGRDTRGYYGYDNGQGPSFAQNGAQQPGAAPPQSPWPTNNQQATAPPLLAPPTNYPAQQGYPQQQQGYAGYPPQNSPAAGWPSPNQSGGPPLQTAATQTGQQQLPPQPPSQVQTAGVAGQSWTNPLPDVGTQTSTAAAGNGAAADPQYQQAATGPTSPWVYAFLIASWAFTFYVGTTYLDIRNKYRAVLRRNPATFNAAL